MKLQLICHGMMLFWYRPPSASGLKDDGYTILIPQLHAHAIPHVFKVDLVAGAPRPLLEYPSTPQGTRFLKLSFGSSASPKRRGAKSRLHNLSFYRNLEYAARPNFGNTAQAGVAFAIDIPYPHKEDAVRASKYENAPYLMGGKAQPAFDIRPRRILGASVFTFENVRPDVEVKFDDPANPANNIPILPQPLAADVKLHIYSQPEVPPTLATNHVEMLNKILKLENLANLHPVQDLDLFVNPFRDATEIVIPPPAGLTLDDAKHLHQFRVSPEPPPVGGHHGSGHAHGGNPAVQLDKRAFDPAECGQGGGCDFDCEEEECP